MNPRDHHPEPSAANRACARVLDLEAADLRADTPLGDLGADAVLTLRHPLHQPAAA